MADSLVHHGSFEAQLENRGRRIVYGSGTDLVLDKLSANHQTVSTTNLTLPDATTLTIGWFVVLDIITPCTIYLGDGSTIGLATTIPRFVIAYLKDNTSVNGVWHFEVSASSGNPAFFFSDFLNKGDVTTGSGAAGDVGLASEFAYPAPSFFQLGLTTYSAFIRFRYKTNGITTDLNLEVYNVTTGSVIQTTTVTPAVANTYYFVSTANITILADNLYKLRIYRSGAGGTATLNIANLIVLAT